MKKVFGGTKFVSWLLGIAGGLTLSARADTIAFFYALDADLQTLKTQCESAGQSLKVGSRSIVVLQLSSHRIYAVKMGSGAVETATSAQALLAKVQCDLAFSTGPVGALADNLKIGEWYRVGEAVCYQKGAWTRTGFQLSPAATVIMTNIATTNLVLPELFQKLDAIKIASGEIFSTSDNYRQQLRETTGATAVDMNLFGLTTVCADHRLPLICWRVVSDRADDHASEDFRKFAISYDGAGGKAVAEIIKHLPANPNSIEAYPNLKMFLSPSK